MVLNRRFEFYKFLGNQNVLILGLLLIGIISRAVTHSLHYVDTPLYGPDDPLYITAVKDNFFQYLYFYHIKPPVNLFIDKIVLLFTNRLSLSRLIIISVLDVVASVMIFSILRDKINKYSAFIFSVIFSMSIITYEIWRDSANHDHIKLFIAVFYLFTLFRIKKESSRLNIFLFMMSTLFISISFSSAFLFFLAIVLVSLIDRNRRRSGLMYGYLFGLVITALISFKNYSNTGNFTQSTSLGQNVIQLVWSCSNKYSNPVEFQKLINHNASYFPDWWIESFNVAIKEDIQAKNEFPFHAIYGVANRDSLTHSIKDKSVLAVLQKDSLLIERKPWLYISEIKESSSLFSAQYGKGSAGTFKIAIKEFPKYFLKQLWFTQKRFFKGPLFFVDDQIYEPTHITINRYYYMWGIFFLIVLNLGMIRILFTVTSFERLKNNQDILLFIILNGVFLNFFTCCENIRMFVPFAPAFFIFGAEFVSEIISFIKLKMKQIDGI